MAIIVLDPGHGGTRKIGGSSPNNAVSVPRGILEKTLTLDVGLRAKKLLQARGHAVYLTRATDVNIGLGDRAAMAKARRADVFLSIHFNGWDKPDVQGSEAFAFPGAPSRSNRLARAVLDEVLKATGYKDRGVKAGAYAVIDPSRHLAITAASLVEISFITTPFEDRRLTDQVYLDALGQGLARGVEAYLAGMLPATTAGLFAPAQDGASAMSGGHAAV